MQKPKTAITGHLDIIVSESVDDTNGILEKWNQILIHGDPEGLRSLAKLLLEIADTDQDSIPNLPAGARAHTHLRPDWDLANSSVEVIVGRLDAKGTGVFYDRYVPRKKG